MRAPTYLYRVVSTSLLAGAIIGCHASSGPVGSQSAGTASGATPLEDAAARARQANRPVVILVVDPGRGEADRAAQAGYASAGTPEDRVMLVLLDLGTSRNRAAAAPLHAVDAPTLVCLSPGGVVLSRDDGTVTATLVRVRAEDAVRLAPGLDQQLAQLQADVTARPGDAGRRMALADFLLAHHNDREAIPHLKRVADDESAELPVRVRAWVAMGRAHLWVIEPEKARHAAAHPTNGAGGVCDWRRPRRRGPARPTRG